MGFTTMTISFATVCFEAYIQFPTVTHCVKWSQRIRQLTSLVLAAQDLNIDLQALASSLSSLPVWDVLDIAAALCKTHQPKQEHQSASINREYALDHAPAEHSAVQPNAAAAVQSRSTMTMHAHSEHDPTTDRSAECTFQVADSPTAEATSSFVSPASAAEGVANMRTQPDAPDLSKQVPAAHHSTSRQTGPAALNSKSDSDDLDALLNASSLSAKPQTATTSVSKPAPREQDSLEDWLNSL